VGGTYDEEGGLKETLLILVIFYLGNLIWSVLMSRLQQSLLIHARRW
jgi:hypothetical protein